MSTSRRISKTVIALLVILGLSLTDAVSDRVVERLPCEIPVHLSERCEAIGPDLTVTVSEIEADGREWVEVFQVEVSNTGDETIENVSCRFDVRGDTDVNIRKKASYGPDGVDPEFLSEIDPDLFDVDDNPERFLPGSKTYMIRLKSVLEDETYSVEVGIRKPTGDGNIHTIDGWCRSSSTPTRRFTWTINSPANP